MIAKDSNGNGIFAEWSSDSNSPEDAIDLKPDVAVGRLPCRNKGEVIAIVEKEDKESEKYADFILRFPSIPSSLNPIPIAVILQLLAYHVANYRKCSIDKPRNLAKSVTVE